MRLHVVLESIFDINFQRSGFLGEQKCVPGISVLSGGDPYPDWLWHYPAWIVNSSGKLRHAFTYTETYWCTHCLVTSLNKQQLVVNVKTQNCWQLSLKQNNAWPFVILYFSSMGLTLPVAIGVYNMKIFLASIEFDKNASKLSRSLGDNWPLWPFTFGGLAYKT